MKETSVDITTFRKVQSDLIAACETAWNSRYGSSRGGRKVYTLEEVEQILNSSSLEALQKLSRDFFDKDGIYTRIIWYYATLLTYAGLLIPNPSFGKDLSTPHISKRYYAALDYVEDLHLPELFTRITKRVLVDGCYYGVIQKLDKNECVIFDLPTSYCRSRFKDLRGNDIVEFNVQYFDSIMDQTSKAQALASYPKMVAHYYDKYHKGKVTDYWVKLPAEIGICFAFDDNAMPMFLSVIPASIQYDDAVDTEREKELEEIRKILVQQIPHLADGQLLFEPEEALEMHKGAVGMMKGNKNLSVLTTYANVDAIVSKTTSENNSTTLEKMLQNVYSEASASAQLFAPTGSQALPTSILNDTSLMMVLGNKYSRFISYILNSLFANTNISFTYNILPLTLYNKKDFLADAFKLAQSGYSLILPGIASGLTQREMVNVKHLENDVLNLNELLIPPTSAYQASGSSGQVGAPEKALDEKAPKTIQNENAIDNQGGSK